jgi:hypothetical protein
LTELVSLLFPLFSVSVFFLSKFGFLEPLLVEIGIYAVGIGLIVLYVAIV